MSEIPATIAAEQALLRQSLALSMIRQSAQAAQAIAAILEQAVQSVPVSGRGANVNLSA